MIKDDITKIYNSDVNWEILLEHPKNFSFTKNNRDIIKDQVCEMLRTKFKMTECPRIEIKKGSIRVIIKNIDISNTNLTKNKVNNILTYTDIFFDNQKLPVTGTKVYTNIKENNPNIIYLKKNLDKLYRKIDVDKYNEYNKFKTYNNGLKKSVENDFFSVDNIGNPIIINLKKSKPRVKNYKRKINKKIFENVMFQAKQLILNY